jgi:hypothetical protein
VRVKVDVVVGDGVGVLVPVLVRVVVGEGVGVLVPVFVRVIVGVPVLVRVGVGVGVNVLVPATVVTRGVAVAGTDDPDLADMQTWSIQYVKLTVVPVMAELCVSH